jgi:hypothetical protein
MAKKNATTSPKSNVAPAKAPVVASRTSSSPAISSTPVRNSAIPPKTPAVAAKKMPPTYDQIAKRAYEISQSGQGGSQDDNWFNAERQLRGI